MVSVTMRRRPSVLQAGSAFVFGAGIFSGSASYLRYSSSWSPCCASPCWPYSPAAAVALAGGTAANVAAISMAKAAELDPVYAAIERERAARADYLATSLSSIRCPTRIFEIVQGALRGKPG
jgi:hypothetical protein